MEITSFKLDSTTAVANGADTITASATITNGSTYASGISVKFSITTGSAVFSNGQSSVQTDSNALGEISAAFVDVTAETIIIEISLVDDPSVHETLTATFTASDNTVDTISLLLTVDDAKADGEDQNLVELQTYSGAIPAGNAAVSVALTNGAVFINGDKTANIKTDSNGRASLPFTSTTVGESKLTAYLSDNIAVYDSVTATFLSASPELSLALDVVSNDAQANGKAVNRVRATVTDSDTLKPLSGQSVTFTLTDGSAVFDNDSTSYTATTNSSGEAQAALKDDVIESVTVKATAGDKSASCTVNFVKTAADLKIARVYNANKSFSTGAPTVAWQGAEFSVDVSGGSGNYSWSVTEGGNVLSLASSSGHSATFKFSSATDNAVVRQAYNVQVMDNATKETKNYSFSLDVFFYQFGVYEYYHVLSPSSYPHKDELLSLYDQWGDMSIYSGWLERGHSLYWTNNLTFLQALTVDLRDGTTFWAGLATEQYFARDYK